MINLMQDTADHFRHQAQHRFANPELGRTSPLYAKLASEIADSRDILSLVSEVDRTQQISELLFAAVHYLLLGGIDHPLADFYPDLVSQPRSHDRAFPYFRDFCFDYQTEIEYLITTQRIQTNEVLRCTGLLPAFQRVAKQIGKQPLCMVELGASAGLNMLWDHYSYHYGHAGHTGARRSTVQLDCMLRGNFQPPISGDMPPTNTRIGIDLNPIDVHDETSTRWLRALIWPEHHEQAKRLNNALEIARLNPPHVVEGDAAVDLLPLLEELPQQGILCIYHCHTLNQMPSAVRRRVLDAIKTHAKVRKLYHISLEWFGDSPQPRLEIFTYHERNIRRELLAYCGDHGEWIEWMPPDISYIEL